MVMVDSDYEEYEKLCSMDGVNPINIQNKKWYEHYLRLKKEYK